MRFFILAYLYSTGSGLAATVTATTAEKADVDTAYAATSPGDTLVIPAGDATWSDDLTVGRALTIRGAGIGSTILRRSSGSAFVYSNNITAIISGMTLIGSSASTGQQLLSLRGLNNKVFDMRFEGTVTKITGVLVSGGTSNPHPTGVVYNCQFLAARVHVQGDLNNTTTFFGRRIWANSDATAAPGTANTIFVEDNDFDKGIDVGENIIDAEYGGHYVFRHNDVIDATCFGHGASSSGERGTKFIEVYGNTFSRDDIAPDDAIVWMRSGTAIVYDNVATGTWAGGMLKFTLEIARYGDNPDDGNTAYANGTGTATATGTTVLTDSGKSWTTNAFVGYELYNLTDGLNATITANTATTITTDATLTWDVPDSYKVTNGYPLRDQIGRGMDAALWVEPADGPAQEFSPAYEWNNTLGGSGVSWSATGGAGEWVEENRDYYNDTEAPGYTPYTYPHPLRGSAVNRGKKKGQGRKLQLTE